MIRTIIQCEHCLEQKDVQSDVLRKMPAPGWFTVSPIDEPALAYHFCSKKCLGKWAGSTPSIDLASFSLSQQKAIKDLQDRIRAHQSTEVTLFGVRHPDLSVSVKFILESCHQRGRGFVEYGVVKDEVCCNEAQSCRS